MAPNRYIAADFHYETALRNDFPGGGYFNRLKRDFLSVIGDIISVYSSFSGHLHALRHRHFSSGISFVR